MRYSRTIEEALELNPATRSSDKELYIEVAQRLGAHLTDVQKDILRAISWNNISKTRVSLQREGKYPASEKVAKHRKSLADRVLNNSRKEA